MMKFIPWSPPGTETPVRFYSSDNSGDYIGKSKGTVYVCSGSNSAIIEEALAGYGINIGAMDSITTTGRLLDDAGLLMPKRGRSGAYSSKGGQGHAKDKYSFVNLTPAQLYEAAENLDISSAPFKASTRKDARVIVDHREPDELFYLLKKTGLQVTQEELKDGDILIHGRDTSRALLIEKKKITDGYNGIVSNDKHCHCQAERYKELAQSYARKGGSLQVIWIYEGEAQGSRLLYNMLPTMQANDGWVNYLICVLGFHIAQTYSQNHTAYLVSKFIQGFLEGQLYYPVKANNITRIDKTKKERMLMEGQPTQQDVEPNDHAVTRSQNGLASMLSLLPGINSSVAKRLADTGLSLSEITSMTKSQLLEIKGIGQTSAEAIFCAFNMKKP